MAGRQAGVTTSENGATLLVPVRRSAGALGPGLALTAFWLAGLVYLPYLAVASDPPLGGLVFLALGELVLVVIATYTVYGLLWNLVGWETLELTPERIAMGYTFMGRNMTREFDRAEVSGPRVEPASSSRVLLKMPAGTVGEGVLAFDHEGVTYRLGRGLGPARAEELLAELLANGGCP